MESQGDAVLRELLALETIAVVGCSTTPGKAAHEVPKYLDEHEYEVIPVNPHADEIFGRKAYDSLSEVPDDVDIVEVFRPSDEVPDIVDEALGRDDVTAIWLQLGIQHEEAARRARDDGREFVQDRCLRTEHQRLLG